MKRFLNCLIFLLVFFLVRQKTFAALGDAEIRGSFDGSDIVIKTTARLAGAIDSLTWKGKEFVDSTDHGRQIQTAWNVNNYGQCYNPTEAGAANDGLKNQSSTSLLLDFRITGQSYITKSKPAFWLNPGVYDDNCEWDVSSSSPPWKSGYTINKTKVSNFILEKNVKIGWQNLDNVIEYVSNITIPQDQNLDVPIRSMILVHPAIYMPTDFSVFYRYDLRTASLSQLMPAYGYSPIPAILATPDGKYSLGLYTPDISWSGFPDNEQKAYTGYATLDWRSFGNTMLLSTRIPVKPEAKSTFDPGTYAYRSYLIIGTLANVQNSMIRLYRYFNSSGLADLNADGKVDIFDYNILVGNFGKTGAAGFTPADIDNNGKVDIFDYNILVGNFGLPAGKAGK
ncbi:hypothetical protein HY086_02325 [Candidatus Gottesmanbacteria bacterium]|nr:hypothetical protein [Candidatus Gottesmanbacteria bacterium]